MRLIALFIAIFTMILIMAKIYENGEVTLGQLFMLAVDIFYIIIISAKLV